MLSDGRQQVERQAVCMWQVAGDELNTAVHQVGDESDIAGKPIELGYDESRAVEPACRERSCELGPSVFAAGLNLNELTDNGVSTCRREVADCSSLGFKAQA
jgi:hypothetical protein